jgi:hypothetical protein
MIYPQTDVFLVFTRIGINSTYENAEKLWIPEIKKYCPGVPFIIVGVSVGDGGRDRQLARQRRLQERREDHTSIGESMAERLGAVKYIECDTVTQHHLKEVFNELTPLQKTSESERESNRINHQAVLAVLEPRRHKEQQRKARPWRPGFLKALGETSGDG